MYSLEFVITTFLIYMLILFIIVYFIENRKIKLNSKIYAYIYSLSLGIYCTAWTYYGSVGKASNDGIIFLAVYLGPTLIIFLWPIILRRLIKLKELYKITSIADLISARYDKSMIIGAFVSFAALAGIIPYISIQLKAIIQSIDILVKDDLKTQTTNIDDVGLIIVALMSFFTIIFGLRKLDPSERHFGMVVIVAIESIIKLFAIVAVGIFVSFFLFDDITTILNEASNRGILKSIDSVNSATSYSDWISIIILSMFAVMFLPRQFHISVVENSDINHIKTAMWVFPLYLLLITFFTIPIAFGGTLLNLNQSLKDFYVLTIPLNFDNAYLSIIAFIGGFSASTSMIMVTAMAMSIMVSNYLILPLVEYSSAFSFLKKRILVVRWVIVIFLIYLSYIFYLYVSKENLIVNIGLISFTAVLQFAPVILGGLFWEKANKHGALAALLSGFAIWFYTLILPQFVNSNWISSSIIDIGPFGLEFLKPTQLFGLMQLNSIPHAVFYSMLFNISAFIIVSLITSRDKQEIKIANEFINILENKEHMGINTKLDSNIDLNEKSKLFEKVLNEYFSSTITKKILRKIKTELNITNNEKINILQLSKFFGKIETTLAGTLGAAGANHALNKSSIFTEEESLSLSNIYADILKHMKITPAEFSKKIDYFEEKQKLLKEHYFQLKEKIKERDIEIDARIKAEEEIRTLNDTLEKKVQERTIQLKKSNEELNQSIKNLKVAQDSLIEAEKMASLGELVAGVAHEINTPVGLSLTGITHLISKSEEILKLYNDDNLSQEEFEEYLKTTKELARSINISLEKTAKLVSSFKQVAVDQSSDDKRKFELDKYIDEILLSLNNITKKTKININVKCPPKIEVNSYPGAFSQIFTNLIMNSLTHAYEKDETNKIDIDVIDKDDKVEIIYKDYGKGIPKENLNKIFNPFFTTNRDEGGSGLGLSIIYNLISNKLKGEISCNSELGFGSTFVITFAKTTS